MILSVLITEFKLGAAGFSNNTFRRVQRLKSPEAMRAVIVWAFIDSDLFTDFPLEEGVMAVRAEGFRFIVFAESPV